jgi:hypothetical protein
VRIERFLLPQERPSLNPEALRNAADVVDGDVALRALNCAQIRAVEPAGVRKGLLAQIALGPKPAHVPGEDIPQGAFVRPLHGRKFRRAPLLRLPLLRYIRAWTARSLQSSESWMPLARANWGPTATQPTSTLSSANEIPRNIISRTSTHKRASRNWLSAKFQGCLSFGTLRKNVGFGAWCAKTAGKPWTSLHCGKGRALTLRGAA